MPSTVPPVPFQRNVHSSRAPRIQQTYLMSTMCVPRGHSISSRPTSWVQCAFPEGIPHPADLPLEYNVRSPRASHIQHTYLLSTMCVPRGHPTSSRPTSWIQCAFPEGIPHPADLPLKYNVHSPRAFHIQQTLLSTMCVPRGHPTSNRPTSWVQCAFPRASHIQQAYLLSTMCVPRGHPTSSRPTSWVQCAFPEGIPHPADLPLEYNVPEGIPHPADTSWVQCAFPEGIPHPADTSWVQCAFPEGIPHAADPLEYNVRSPMASHIQQTYFLSTMCVPQGIPHPTNLPLEYNARSPRASHIQQAYLLSTMCVPRGHPTSSRPTSWVQCAFPESIPHPTDLPLEYNVRSPGHPTSNRPTSWVQCAFPEDNPHPTDLPLEYNVRSPRASYIQQTYLLSTMCIPRGHPTSSRPTSWVQCAFPEGIPHPADLPLEYNVRSPRASHTQQTYLLSTMCVPRGHPTSSRPTSWVQCAFPEGIPHPADLPLEYNVRSPRASHTQQTYLFSTMCVPRGHPTPSRPTSSVQCAFPEGIQHPAVRPHDWDVGSCFARPLETPPGWTHLCDSSCHW